MVFCMFLQYIELELILPYFMSVQSNALSGRINVTIKALLALKAAADSAKREKEAVEQKQASLVKTAAQAVIKRTKDKQQTPAAN